jgi:putative transposase
MLRYVVLRRQATSVCGRKNAFWLIKNLRGQAIAFRFAVHAYCVMPDHFHGLFSGLEPSSDLLAFVKNLKGTTSNEYRRKTEQDLWQKKFYDHILREDDNAVRVAGYIWMNPVRKGLCVDPREYPYSGSFVRDWMKEVMPVESWVPSWKGKDKSAAG